MTPAIELRRDDLSGPEVRALLETHLRGMAEHSPPESVHALDLDGLRRPEITFWAAWQGSELLGCGALKQLGPRDGEVKSMRTAQAHQRRGVARVMVKHLIAEARARGYTRLWLETGSMAAFEPARQLYASVGFIFCEPFGDYRLDPNSVFMTLSLQPAGDR